MQKTWGFFYALFFIKRVVRKSGFSGLLWEQECAGSNPVDPTMFVFAGLTNTDAKQVLYARFIYGLVYQVFILIKRVRVPYRVQSKNDGDVGSGFFQLRFGI
jgi:hypothetical protein